MADHLRTGTDPQDVHAAFIRVLTNRVPYCRRPARGRAFLLRALEAQLLTEGPSFVGQPAPLRIPHAVGIPQGS
ncbi:hypothetical protein ACFWIO_23605 [Streptomyces diastatochromogenes]|uniref:hypothetical protein n=1 Tax=Streptomyces diastatochromogenes TaxID=42236 RepID=UPI0036665553